MRQLSRPSLDLSSINDANVDEINDFASHLINVGNSIGLFHTATPLQSREANSVYTLAKGWLTTVDRHLRTMSPAEALQLADAYEIMQRIAYGQSVRSEEINRVRLEAFDAMIHGDKNVDQYIMFKAIRRAVGQREKAFLDKPLRWSCITEERWHKEAREGFDRSVLSDYDILARVGILLESDLYAYEGRNQDLFKRRLATQHRHYLDGYTAPDRRTELALNTFRLTAPRYIAMEL